MRTTGFLDSPSDLGPNDHLCWDYGDPERFHREAAQFLADGLRQGLRVAYAASAPIAELRTHLAALPDADELIRRGSLQVLSLDDIYGRGVVVDATSALAAYASATEQALADGYRGFRITAEATELVRTPEQHEAFTRYEHVVDRYCATHPFSAMCAYNAELGEDAVTGLAELHPAARSAATPFRMFAGPCGEVLLAGELDFESRPEFERALSLVRPEPGGAALILDLSGVTFVDHRALMALDGFAASQPVTVVARQAPASARRLAGLLPLRHLVVADVPA